jgi:hypothetical protein
MKTGYYCIYECSENKWLMKNEWWANDRDLLSVKIPVEYKLNSYPTGDGEKEYQLIHNNYRDVALMSSDYKVDKFQLIKFETMREAEDWLVSSPLTTNNGQFYSIRKIYM